jgi:hypothetical protein
MLHIGVDKEGNPQSGIYNTMMLIDAPSNATHLMLPNLLTGIALDSGGSFPTTFPPPPLAVAVQLMPQE